MFLSKHYFDNLLAVLWREIKLRCFEDGDNVTVLKELWAHREIIQFGLIRICLGFNRYI